jgi:putative secretion ATPase (PEP-CTERM system associated)
MYQEFYTLHAEPFRLSPDHRFCYDHKGYAKARAYMAYAFSQAEGFVMITGRPGTGKTTLIGELIDSLAGDNVTTANLVCNQLQADDLLKMVAYSFGAGHGATSKSELLQQLDALFRKWHREGHRALLIVDEAQDLSTCAMEELRLLGNIQSDGKPLLQIFLLGQPELRDLVHSPALEQVHQRIVAASHLEPLKQDETEAYIRHRLETVGWTGDPAFSKPLFPLIHKFSEGVPRRINLICSRLFLHGSVEQKHTLGVQDLREVIEELKSEQLAIGSFISHEDFAVEDEFEEISPPQQPGEIAPVAACPEPVIDKTEERLAEVAAASPAVVSEHAARFQATDASGRHRQQPGRRLLAVSITVILALIIAGGFVFAPNHIVPDSWHSRMAAVWQSVGAEMEALTSRGLALVKPTRSTGAAQDSHIGRSEKPAEHDLPPGEITRPLETVAEAANAIDPESATEVTEPDFQPLAAVTQEQGSGELSIPPGAQPADEMIDEDAVIDTALDTEVAEPGSQQIVTLPPGEELPGLKISVGDTVVTTQTPTAIAQDTPTTRESPTTTTQELAATLEESTVTTEEPAFTEAPESEPAPLEPRLIVVEFGFDSARLSAQAERQLDEVAASVAGSSQQIHISGYSDSRGDPDYNQRLSGQRAATVAAYLQDHGIYAERLVVEGRGIYDENNALELQREQVASIASQRFVQVVFDQTATPR